jgi:hypothetical protein
MPVTVEEFKRLKSKVEKKQAEAAKAEGAYEESLKRLAELGYDSVEEADEGLVKLEAELTEAEADYERELAAFKAEWGDKLDA